MELDSYVYEKCILKKQSFLPFVSKMQFLHWIVGTQLVYQLPGRDALKEQQHD
jgi:hypothetical protein